METDTKLLAVAGYTLEHSEPAKLCSSRFDVRKGFQIVMWIFSPRWPKLPRVAEIVPMTVTLEVGHDKVEPYLLFVSEILVL